METKTTILERFRGLITIHTVLVTLHDIFMLFARIMHNILRRLLFYGHTSTVVHML